MAVNESRSLTRDLREGLTDGSVKKVAPDRGGSVEPDAHLSYALQEQYGSYYDPSLVNTVANRYHDGRVIS